LLPLVLAQESWIPACAGMGGDGQVLDAPFSRNTTAAGQLLQRISEPRPYDLRHQDNEIEKTKAVSATNKA
jgi:hypothetical protein